MSDTTNLIERLATEADQCRNDGANDIAKLLDEAVTELQTLGVQAYAGQVGQMRLAAELDSTNRPCRCGPDDCADSACPGRGAPVAPAERDEFALFRNDLCDFLRHVIDMGKGDHYWDVVCGNAGALLRRVARIAPVAPADDWRQYATEREDTAQQVIERHRAEQDALLKLLADARRLAVPMAPAKPQQWLPIETAPQDGRTILLGCFNSHGKWRTMLGQWMSADYISEYFEDPDSADPGWFETCVESDEIPNCWPIRPTHWMLLPAAPTAPAAVLLTEADAAHEYGINAPVAPVDGLTS